MLEQQLVALMRDPMCQGSTRQNGLIFIASKPIAQLISKLAKG
jgi:hypothetical protein